MGNSKSDLRKRHKHLENNGRSHRDDRHPYTPEPIAQRFASEPSLPTRKQKPEPPDRQKTIVKALYDYSRRYDDDISFKKDDKLEIISKGNEDDWWMAMHVKTRRKGFIPNNYVVLDNDSVESQDWWFNLDRREATKQLMLPGNPLGTFLIRNSSDTSSYALSLLDKDAEDQLVIRHFQIRRLDNGGCYITARNSFYTTFKTVIDLVAFYKETNALGRKLTRSCPREVLPIPFKDLEVKREDIALGKKLGAGQFGEVFSAKFRKVVDVAVKTLKVGSMAPEAFLEEAKTMHKLRHRKLVLLMGVCTVGEPKYIITEKMENGSLLDYLRNSKSQITYPSLMDMAAQIADGMMYLESENFIHRDLRAANILVGENFNVKVADFGLARILNEIYSGEGIYTPSGNAIFPIKWTAPEAFMFSTFSIKSDVWSYGIVLHEMVTYGMVPYPGMDNVTTRTSIQKGYRMPKPGGPGIVCDDILYEKMLTCWHRNPENRPTFEHLKNFFEDYSVNTEASYQEG